MKLDSWVLEVILCLFFLLMLREGRLTLGRERTSIFLWGSILWTGIIDLRSVVYFLSLSAFALALNTLVLDR